MLTQSRKIFNRFQKIIHFARPKKSSLHETRWHIFGNLYIKKDEKKVKTILTNSQNRIPLLQNCNLAKTRMRYSTLTITNGCKSLPFRRGLHNKEGYIYEYH